MIRPHDGSTPVGWFVDVADDDEFHESYPYQAFVQLAHGCYPLPIWFRTEAECERFIREEVLGLGLLDD